MGRLTNVTNMAPTPGFDAGLGGADGAGAAGKSGRDPVFDNAKALLLFLVALGHTLEMYRLTNFSDELAMKYLYLFHMPLFAFITGYFTKDFARARNTAVKALLVPYVIFQSAYVILATILIRVGAAKFNAELFRPSLLVPTSAFYYLVAVFFWRSLAGVFKVRHPLALSVAIGTLVSITHETSFHFGHAAVFTLLPFFVLGVKCDRPAMAQIRSLPRWAAVGILAAGILPSLFLPSFFVHNIRATYASTGMTNLAGMANRLAFYAIAAAMSVAVLNVMPARRFWFTRIGESSLLVYCLSTFLSPHAYRLLEISIGIPRSGPIHWACVIAFCIATVYIASSKVFSSMFAKLADLIWGLLKGSGT